MKGDRFLHHYLHCIALRIRDWDTRISSSNQRRYRDSIGYSTYTIYVRGIGERRNGIERIWKERSRLKESNGIRVYDWWLRFETDFVRVIFRGVKMDRMLIKWTGFTRVWFRVRFTFVRSGFYIEWGPWKKTMKQHQSDKEATFD